MLSQKGPPAPGYRLPISNTGDIFLGVDDITEEARGACVSRGKRRKEQSAEGKKRRRALLLLDRRVH
ncbi:hypothetical protein EYF80_004786 [Liparis tanakae]|uniref:Uncharacterized protein n=1 Tax=Liparis tanakae TaxID=230148 RepID=A0A4Z2J476_9TELE|nr:hypothetical protein EYF80_004786 [Liparis tanakae]